MHAGFAQESQRTGQLRFGPKAVGVAHARIGRVHGVLARATRAQAQGQHHGAQRFGLVAVDAQRLEQIGQAQLQTGHTRMRGGQFGRAGQGARGFHGDKEFILKAGGNGLGGGLAQRRGAFHLGQIQQVDRQAAQRVQVGGKVRGVGRIHANDNFLGM
ncbi:hypothetical protein D3C72_1104060 [compost metagenome]